MSLLNKVKSFKQEFGKQAVALGTATALTLAPVGNALAADFNAANVQNASHSQSAQPYELIEDNGVLWFKKGTDGRTKYGVAQDLSTETGLSIVASSSPDPKDGVANVGRQIKGWLESHHDIDEVSLIAAEDLKSGGGLVFYIDGLRYSPSPEHHGNLRISEVSALLPKIVSLYREYREYKEQEVAALSQDHHQQYALK